MIVSDYLHIFVSNYSLMTEKQERILTCALELFAENGYDATSTSKVAKAAGVSEGLIFRHFDSKQGLLEAILSLGHEQADALYASVIESGKAPLRMLGDILSLPFGIDQTQFKFWKLVYALKWQTDQYEDSMTSPLRNKLMQIFHELGYADPEAETDLVLLFLDGVATTILLKDKDNLEMIKQAILRKYNIESN